MLLLAALIGCYTESDYAEGFTEADCTLRLECYSEDALSYLDYSDVEGCMAYEADTIDRIAAEKAAEDCAYDRKAARECVEGMYALSCEDYLLNDFPQSCQEICGDGAR